MKTKIASLIGMAALLAMITGCSSTNITKLINAAGKDSAVVSGTVTSVYGTVKFVRVGPTTNSVTVSPDGTVTVNK